MIAEITNRMGNGMAKFIESEVCDSRGICEVWYSTLLSGSVKSKRLPTPIWVSSSSIFLVFCMTSSSKLI